MSAQLTLQFHPSEVLSAGDTPLYRTWRAMKNAYPGVIMLLKVGDFYELFGEDADCAGDVLNLSVCKADSPDGLISMAGIPYHSLDRYLRQLVAKGFRAAVCTQEVA